MYNKIFSGYQSRQMVEWRKNQYFYDHLRPRPQGTGQSMYGSIILKLILTELEYEGVD
jgi:hypothetical protein